MEYEIRESLNMILEFIPWIAMSIAFGFGYIELDWDLINFIRNKARRFYYYVFKHTETTDRYETTFTSKNK